MTRLIFSAHFACFFDYISFGKRQTFINGYSSENINDCQYTECGSAWNMTRALSLDCPWTLKKWINEERYRNLLISVWFCSEQQLQMSNYHKNPSNHICWKTLLPKLLLTAGTNSVIATHDDFKMNSYRAEPGDAG